MTRKWAILSLASSRARLLKTFPKIGCARSAAWARTISSLTKNELRIFLERSGISRSRRVCIAYPGTAFWQKTPSPSRLGNSIPKHILHILREFGIRRVGKKLVISPMFCIFIAENQNTTKRTSDDYQGESYRVFCIIDEFDKNLSAELSKNLRLPSVGKDGTRHRNHPDRISESEIMTVLVCYHFGTYRTFKDYYLNCIRGSMKDCFPDKVSYNRFVELMPRVFFRIHPKLGVFFRSV